MLERQTKHANGLMKDTFFAATRSLDNGPKIKPIPGFNCIWLEDDTAVLLGGGAAPSRVLLNTWKNSMQMVSLYTEFCLSVFYFHHIHLFLCVVADLEFIGPPEYRGKMLHNIG